MNTAAAVHLRTLHLRGAAGEVAEARARLPAQLATVTWPSAAQDRSVVIVRRVRIEGTPAELAARMAEAVHRLAAQAVSADSPGADTAEAVRFTDRTDCTARFIRDLLAGRAQHRWLWRHQADRLTQPLAEAVVGLLAQDALALPGLMERVRGLGSAPALWRVLDGAPGQVRTLLDAVGQATGWGLALHRACQPVATVADPQADPQAVLRAVLRLWREAPARLSSPQADRVLRECARGCVGGEAHLDARPHPSPPPLGEGARPDAASRSPRSGDAPHDTPHDASNTAAHRTQHRKPDSSPQRGEAGRGASAVSPPATPAPLFHTRVGGVLLLLNVLDRPDLRTWRGTWDEPQAGWRHLVRLAGALDAAFDPPLTAFLADACGLDHPDALLRLASQGTADEVWRLAERQFGHALLRSAVAGGPAWLRCDEPWIDVHFRLADARADLRRTGLDLDPGWLPWLGRVVRFHYDEAP